MNQALLRLRCWLLVLRRLLLWLLRLRIRLLNRLLRLRVSLCLRRWLLTHRLCFRHHAWGEQRLARAIIHQIFHRRKLEIR